MNGLFKTEPIKLSGPWHSAGQVEIATLVDGGPLVPGRHVTFCAGQR